MTTTSITFGHVYPYDPKQFKNSHVKKHNPQDIVFKDRQTLEFNDFGKRKLSKDRFVATGEDARQIRAALDIYKKTRHWSSNIDRFPSLG
jgi:hypothetical protein